MQGIWLYSYIALWVLMLGLAVGLIAVGRYIGDILQQVSRVGARGQMPDSGPAVGSRLWDEPPAVLRSAIPKLGDSSLLVTIFVSSTCPHCRNLVASLGSLRDIPEIQPIVFTRDEIGDTDPYAEELGKFRIPYMYAGDLFKKGEVNLVPTSMVVNGQGLVLEKHAGNDIARIHAMITAHRAA